MQTIWKHLSFLLALTLSLQTAYADEISIQDILDLEATVSLNGSEESHWYAINQNLKEFQYTDAKKNPTEFLNQWRPYYPPKNAYDGNEDWENSEILTYIKFFRLPKELPSPHYSVRLGVITDKDEAYLNGYRIGANGDFSHTNPDGYDKVRVYKIPKEILRLGEVNTLLILNKPYFSYSAGIEQDKLLLGPSESIEGDLLKDEYVKLLLLTIYLTVAFYFLFLFIRRLKDVENLFFGLFTICLVIYQFLRNQLKYELGFEFIHLKKTEYLVLMFLVPLKYHFIRSYFKFKYHWVYKITDSIIGIVFLFILFTSDIIQYDFLNKNVVQPLWILYIIACIYFLVSRAIQKDLDAALMLGGFIFLIVAAFLDILSTRNVIVFPRVSGYAFITLILSIATILANKFVRLNSQVEELNANLEKKVEERTEELNNTLEEVRKLKIQQDGDYFLTSLLLNPLISNRTKSEKIKIDFFTKQKKIFEFKGKKHEIGGDISISSNIELRGKKYTVFINGDAMGKSMQGAGGALVLGVVFNAVLTRSNAEANRNKHPEIWIREAFMDLQRVFESFNGSMLISVVMGLIDENSGLLYYINAEHPWTVLYRDGKASFLESELVLRKLGTPGNEESFFVRIFPLKPGDILIAGSDGRDDILLGYDENGIRIINENEETFLKVVEEGKGEMDSIISKLESLGEYTDDITLLRIEYTQGVPATTLENEKNGSKPLYLKARKLLQEGNFSTALEFLNKSLDEEPYDLESTQLLLAQTHFKIKNWEEALKYFERYVDTNPESTENLFYASYSARMARKMEKAIEYGERCFLRDPNHIKNLVNLAYIYKKTNRNERALYLLERALKEDSDNKDALRLKEIIGKEATESVSL